MDEKKFDLDELRDAHRILGGLLDDADEGQGVIAWMDEMGRALDAVARFSPGRNALLEALQAALTTNRIACDLAEHLGEQGPTGATWPPLARAAIRLATGAQP